MTEIPLAKYLTILMVNLSDINTAHICRSGQTFSGNNTKAEIFAIVLSQRNSTLSYAMSLFNEDLLIYFDNRKVIRALEVVTKDRLNQITKMIWNLWKVGCLVCTLEFAVNRKQWVVLYPVNETGPICTADLYTHDTNTNGKYCKVVSVSHVLNV